MLCISGRSGTRCLLALYDQFGFRSDEETIKKISLAVGRKPKLVRKILTGGLRNTGYVDIYAGEECDGIEEYASTSATDPYVVLCRQEAFDAVWQAYESLEYRQRDIVAARLGFCMECGSTRRSVMEGNEKMLRRIPKKAFIDIAAEHMMTPNSAERIYDQAIQKMRK